MNKFIDEIKGKKIAHGEKLESEALIIAQKVLHNMGLGMIPKSYSDFLWHYNGLKFEGSYLFGATVDDDLDIIDKNEQIKKPKDMILLGCNDFDLLCYDCKAADYKIIDRSDFKVIERYADNELDFALSKIFEF